MRRLFRTSPQGLGRLRVLAAGLDPHALDQVTRSLEGAHIEEAVADELDPAGLGDTDLLIIDLERTTSPTVARSAGTRVIGLVPTGVRDRATPEGVDVVLQRPLLPGEITEAAKELLGVRRMRKLDIYDWTDRADWWLDRARLVAVAIAAVFELVRPGTSFDSAVLAVAFVYAFLRFPLRSRRFVVWIDVLLVAGILAATGGPTSSYVILAIVTAGSAGAFLGWLPGLGAGLVLALGGTPYYIEQLGVDPPSQVLAWFLLLPLAAATAGFAADIWGPRDQDAAVALREVNRLLRDVHRIARSMPAGLDLRSVAETSMQEIRHRLDVPAAMLFVDDAAEAVMIGAYGHADAPYRPFDWTLVADLVDNGIGIIENEGLTPPLDRILTGYSHWIVVPLRHGGDLIGVLFVASDGTRPDTNMRRTLTTIADQTALAVENARIFDRIRELAVDAERWRLAGDLHDGVAQALTHIRLELDLLSRQGSADPEQTQQEIERLARVVGRSLGDVRDLIEGLRATAGAVGLATALREYVRDFSGIGGPDIRFQARKEVVLDPTVEKQIFRIAQEAISNALRHSRADTVHVTLGVVEGHLRLSVIDDGEGMGDPERRTPGVGIRSMRERAQRIGGELEIEDREEGGTRVTLLLSLRGVGEARGASVAGAGR